MLLMPNKKKIASLIVSGSKPDYVQKMGEKGPDKPFDLSELEDDDMGEEYSAGLEAAADKIASSIKKGDTANLVSSLKDFIEMCSFKGPKGDD